MNSWVVRRGDLNLGPFTTSELRAEIRSGAVRPHDLAWAEGVADWAPLSSYAEFASSELPSESPPAASSPPPVLAAPALTASAPQKRSIWLMLLLTLLTLGFYPSFWFVVNRKSLAALGTRSPVDTPLPVVGLTLYATAAVVTFVAEDVGQLLGLLGSILLLLQSFRVLRVLREFTKRTKQSTTLSGVLTFFLHAFYLQYKMNRMQWRPDA
jgi:hypothetical protein